MCASAPSVRARSSIASSSSLVGMEAPRDWTRPIVRSRSRSYRACSSEKISARFRMIAIKLNLISLAEYWSIRLWISGRAAASQSSGGHSPRQIGPDLRPSSSYSLPLIGMYEMKWYSSSSFSAPRPSRMNGSARAKLLCALRTRSLLLIASPFRFGGNSLVNSLKLVSSAPSDTPGALRRIERIACVAHALLMTCEAKKTSCDGSVSTGRSSCSFARHLKRKMRP
mmetsp:Transcript_20633/g.64150  ORF Transcript_20633/g.64150 Transcript_20633/m.64150 type:complete len:226 (-) Transcript_20633:21-698(-)